MSASNPLAGLTEREADQAIDRFAAKVDTAEADLKAAKDHLKAMKAARKTLTEPEAAPEDNGTRADAQAAELSTEAGER